MTRTVRHALAAISFTLLLAPASVLAQPGAAAPRRQRMEQQLRQGLWRITKERAGLTDEQMAKLQATTARFDPRRRALMADDREQRQLLRAELVPAHTPDQDRVGAALDRLLAIQRQRVDLNAEEQRELAGFMTPVQRARFAALQEQVRRRAEALRRNRREIPPAE
jgi:Spy/CpxP family protein refolding chaperone